MNELVFMNNDQIVTSSRNVARDFGKRHDHVIRDIERVIESLPKNGEAQDMFYETYYTHPQNKQQYRMFLMNRDGFTLLVMGFTGSKAMEFKFKYINAFNDMEKQIQAQQKPKTQLEILQQSINQMVEQEKRINEIEQKQENITNIIKLNNSRNWREETNKIINSIARNNGGTYKQTRQESYSRLETRARCDLEARLRNKLNRLKEQGAPKRTLNNLNYLDVIADDDRLIEIYLSIVKEMAVEHNVERAI